MPSIDSTTPSSPGDDRKPAARPSPSSSSAPPPVCHLLHTVPADMQISILTYLRATDLAVVQQTCQHFNDRTLIHAVIRHAAEFVYPPELTEGFDTPAIGGEVNSQTAAAAGGGSDPWLTYEAMRNMEMLVVARVLSRPEPPVHERDGFYVSKSWCRAALRWLEVQQEERREKERLQLTSAAAAATASAASRNPHASKKKKGKKSKKQERIRNRKLSDALPPWPNVNNDIACPHGDLARCSSKSARARRRTLDKQAWRVLKKLYPDSTQLSSVRSECIQCLMEAETAKKTEADRRECEKEERKRPLSCPVVRGIYTRSKGVPSNCLVSTDAASASASLPSTPLKKPAHRGGGNTCPLVPGVYNALPRSWCHRWRRYLKTGEGEVPVAPDATALLCDAHRLPLVPPHLEAFLYGEIPSLLGGGPSDDAAGTAAALTPNGPISPPAAAAASSPFASAATTTSQHPHSFSPVPVGLNPVRRESEEEEAVISALRAAGLSESEVHSQRLAMQNHERQSHMAAAASSSPHSSLQGGMRRTSSNSNLNAAATADASSSSMCRESSAKELLDRENYLVVEILTDEEFSALERWWPEISSSYALRFAVTENVGAAGSGAGGCGGCGTSTSTSTTTSVVWSTAPCRECDASGKSCRDFVGQRVQRARRIRRNGTVPNGKGR